jgi:hypothetical protein
MRLTSGRPHFDKLAQTLAPFVAVARKSRGRRRRVPRPTARRGPTNAAIRKCAESAGSRSRLAAVFRQQSASSTPTYIDHREPQAADLGAHDQPHRDPHPLGVPRPMPKLHQATPGAERPGLSARNRRRILGPCRPRTSRWRGGRMPPACGRERMSVTRPSQREGSNRSIGTSAARSERRRVDRGHLAVRRLRAGLRDPRCAREDLARRPLAATDGL